MSNQNKNECKKLARWQEISGITAENENSLSADARDEGIRKLLREVDVMARAEFTRGEHAPAGERTIYWEPLERVCRVLEISRVKLSALSRELTGLRAYELTDRIKAESLPKLLSARVQRVLTPELALLRHSVDRARIENEHYRMSIAMQIWKRIKQQRSGAARARWAAELGFPNASRLSRACLIAHRASIDELEGNLVICMVQKFFEELMTEKKNQPQMTQRAQSTKKGEERRTDLADAIIREAVEAVVSSSRGRVA